MVGGAFMRFVYSTLAMMGLFITAFDKHDRARDKFQMEAREPPTTVIESYDFIIGKFSKGKDKGSQRNIFIILLVGGGTAGLIVANRLSTKYKVLVVEAGGEPFPFQSIPSLSPYMMMNRKELAWNFHTIPQRHACQAMNKQVSVYVHAK